MERPDCNRRRVEMARMAADGVASLTAEMTRAAAGFLDSLQDAQRDKAAVAFEDDATRRRWYYTPTPRHGLAIREMTAEQYQWVRRLMAAGLSEAGYNYAAIVLSLEWAVDYH